MRTARSGARRACPSVGAFDGGGRCELLAQLTYPLTPAAFFRRHWRQKALAVHGGRRRFRRFVRERLHSLSLVKLLEDSPSDEVHVWFSTASGGNESMKTADREAALNGDIKKNEPTQDDLKAAHRELGKVSLADFGAMLRDAAADDAERASLTDDMVRRMYGGMRQGLKDPSSIKRMSAKDGAAATSP